MNNIFAYPISLRIYYNQYTNSGGACNASYDTPLRVEALQTCRVLVAGTVHSHKVMRSSWVKWCWKWIISSLFPNGTVGTFFLGPCTLRPSILHQHAGQWLHSSQAKPPPLKQRHLTGSPHLIQSWPYYTGRLQQQLFSKKYYDFLFFFPFWALTHLRLKFNHKLLQPRSRYCLPR